MKGYRTLIFAVLLAAAGALQATFPALQAHITPELYGYATVAIAVIVGVLRAVTDTGVLKGSA